MQARCFSGADLSLLHFMSLGPRSTLLNPSKLKPVMINLTNLSCSMMKERKCYCYGKLQSNSEFKHILIHLLSFGTSVINII